MFVLKQDSLKFYGFYRFAENESYFSIYIYTHVNIFKFKKDCYSLLMRELFLNGSFIISGFDLKMPLFIVRRLDRKYPLAGACAYIW